MTQNHKSQTKLKYQTDIKTKDFYNHYKKWVKENNLSDKFNLSETQFRKIWKEFHISVFKSIIEENFIFKTPYLNVKIRIKKYKQDIEFDENGKLKNKKYPIDWQATRKMWAEKPETQKEGKKIYFLNDHTDGYRYRFFFSYFLSKTKHIKWYNFKPMRYLDRKLSQQLKDVYNKIDYFE